MWREIVNLANAIQPKIELVELARFRERYEPDTHVLCVSILDNQALRVRLSVTRSGRRDTLLLA
jgi:hypothetical protein